MASKDSSHALTELEVTRIIEEASSFEDAAPELLRALCEGLAWRVGELWMLDADAGLLRRKAVWHAEDPDLSGFALMARGIATSRGYGIPGRVLASGSLEWVRDVRADQTFMRSDAADRAGLRFAVGIPLTDGKDVNGAVLLLRPEAVECEGDLPATLIAVGRKIGEFALQDGAVRRSPAYFRVIVENQADIVALIGLDGAIRYESAAVKDVLGYTRRERLGRNVFEFIHPEDVPDALAAFRVVLDQPGRPHVVRVRVRHKDGSWRLIESTGRVIVDNTGTHTALISSRDISDRAGQGSPSTSAAHAASPGGLSMTDQEIEILRLVAAGMTNKKIGETVCLSPNTVKDHLRAILRKLDARNRAAAVAAASKRGLL